MSSLQSFHLFPHKEKISSWVTLSPVFTKRGQRSQSKYAARPSSRLCRFLQPDTGGIELLEDLLLPKGFYLHHACRYARCTGSYVKTRKTRNPSMVISYRPVKFCECLLHDHPPSSPTSRALQLMWLCRMVVTSWLCIFYSLFGVSTQGKNIGLRCSR